MSRDVGHVLEKEKECRINIKKNSKAPRILAILCPVPRSLKIFESLRKHKNESSDPQRKKGVRFF